MVTRQNGNVITKPCRFTGVPLPDNNTVQKVDPMSDTSGSEPAPTEAVVAQKSPYAVDVEDGKKYWWCTCGRSAKQPFCDGSHKGTQFAPLEYAADKAGTLYFCGCKATGKGPLCDGSHSKI